MTTIEAFDTYVSPPLVKSVTVDGDGDSMHVEYRDHRGVKYATVTVIQDGTPSSVCLSLEDAEQQHAALGRAIEHMRRVR